jgi:hypothetical protein
VVEAAAGADEELGELAEAFARQRRIGMGNLAEELDQRGALPRETSVDDATDVLWMMSNPANYHWFVVERGWAPERYAQWLGEALIGLLVEPSYEPRHP